MGTLARWEREGFPIDTDIVDEAADGTVKDFVRLADDLDKAWDFVKSNKKVRTLGPFRSFLSPSRLIAGHHAILIMGCSRSQPLPCAQVHTDLTSSGHGLETSQPNACRFARWKRASSWGTAAPML